MKSALRAGALLSAVALLGGCVATQRDVLDLENQTDQLKVQITDLKKTVTSLQENQADLAVQMKQLHEDLSTFTEAVRENQDQMGKLSSKLDDMGAKVASNVESIGTSLKAQQLKNLEEQKAELQKAEQARANSPTELFNTADVRLAVKNYELAAKGFEQYLAKFPTGALVDVAYYKLGQSYYGLKHWKEAGEQFAVVLEKYPKSAMTASSRLMYALCLVNMKKSLDEARQYLESVVDDFPRTPEAKAAEAELRRLGKPIAKKAP
jgi:tol-pal system protein YbgF